MRNLALIPALLVALLLVACGGGGASKPAPTLLSQHSIEATATLRAVATQNALFDETSEARYQTYVHHTPPPTAPTPTPLIAGPDVRPCTAFDVVAALAGRNGAPATAFIDIGLGNRSTTACQLGSVPDVLGMDNSGSALTLDVSVEDPCPTENPIGGFCVFPFPVLLLPGLGDITQQHRLKTGQAVLILSLRSPAACPSAVLVVPGVSLLLPDSGGEVEVRDLSLSACSGHADVISFAPTTAPN